MSHISQVETQFSDLGSLTEACASTGLEIVRGQDLTVQDYRGHTVPVEAKILLGKYDLGFQKQEDGTYRMVADFWGIGKYCTIIKVREAIKKAGSAENGMVRLISKPYVVAAAKKEVRTKAKYRGFQVQEMKNQAGEVQRLLLVRRRY